MYRFKVLGNLCINKAVVPVLVKSKTTNCAGHTCMSLITPLSNTHNLELVKYFISWYYTKPSKAFGIYEAAVLYYLTLKVCTTFDIRPPWKDLSQSSQSVKNIILLVNLRQLEKHLWIHYNCQLPANYNLEMEQL